MKHIALADAADLAILAPATANIIGKLSHGIADDALSTVFLAVRSPVLIAPAMNEAMFADRQDVVDTTLAMAAGGDTEEAAAMQQALIDESFENGGQQGPVAVGPAPR